MSDVLETAIDGLEASVHRAMTEIDRLRAINAALGSARSAIAKAKGE